MEDQLSERNTKNTYFTIIWMLIENLITLLKEM